MVVARHSDGAGVSAILSPELDLPRITLRADEFAAYRAAIIACAGAQEKAPCERLLGQIASLAAPNHGTETLTFTPGASSAALAMRALRVLRGETTPSAAVGP